MKFLTDFLCKIGIHNFPGIAHSTTRIVYRSKGRIEVLVEDRCRWCGRVRLIDV